MITWSYLTRKDIPRIILIQRGIFPIFTILLYCTICANRLDKPANRRSPKKSAYFYDFQQVRIGARLCTIPNPDRTGSLITWWWPVWSGGGTSWTHHFRIKKSRRDKCPRTNNCGSRFRCLVEACLSRTRIPGLSGADNRTDTEITRVIFSWLFM